MYLWAQVGWQECRMARTRQARPCARPPNTLHARPARRATSPPPRAAAGSRSPAAAPAPRPTPAGAPRTRSATHPTQTTPAGPGGPRRWAWPWGAGRGAGSGALAQQWNRGPRGRWQRATHWSRKTVGSSAPSRQGMRGGANRPANLLARTLMLAVGGRRALGGWLHLLVRVGVHSANELPPVGEFAPGASISESVWPGAVPAAVTARPFSGAPPLR